MSLLIVDDHAAFRAFARRLLGADGFDVAGEAADGESALAEVERLHPDVVLLDVNLPTIDGFEVARRLLASGDGPAVVLTSTRPRSDYGTRIAESPVAGFIPKHDLSGAALAELVS